MFSLFHFLSLSFLPSYLSHASFELPFIHCFRRYWGNFILTYSIALDVAEG
jgi:hypothetical protein